MKHLAWNRCTALAWRIRARRRPLGHKLYRALHCYGVPALMIITAWPR